MGKKSDLAILKVFAVKLMKDFYISKIIFFGSRARKDNKNDSDFDVIIVSKDFEGMDFFDRVSKMYSYWNYNAPIDFMCYTENEFNKLKERISIVRDAIKTGIVVQ